MGASRGPIRSFLRLKRKNINDIWRREWNWDPTFSRDLAPGERGRMRFLALAWRVLATPPAPPARVSR
jgi:hypothetical protein